MSKRSVRALGIFVAFYVVFGVVLAFFQERVVYQPFAQDFEACAQFAEAEKVSYNGTRMYVRDADKPVAVLYHGNAGSACDRDFYAELFLESGDGYVVVEYAGYSNDTQKPTHERIKQDARNVIDFLNERGIENVTLVGESIGTGVAAYHASLAPPEKLLLISPFTDLKDVARVHWRYYPTSLLVDNAFDNVAALAGYRGQVTIVHGTEDSIIPFRLGETLYDTLVSEKEFVAIEGAGHNDLFAYTSTRRAVVTMLVRMR